MPLSEPSTCPRCLNQFDCRANIGGCQCNNIGLTPAIHAWLAERYEKCLCMECLHDINNNFNSISKNMDEA